MRIVPFDGDAVRWDSVVAGSTLAPSVSQLAAWREIIDESLGLETLYQVAVSEAGTWLGVLPLVRVQTPMLEQLLLSMPFLNAGGPAGQSQAQTALMDWSLAEARRRNADLVELRTREAIASDLRPSLRKITVKLSLPATAPELFAAFPSKLRSQLRRSQREAYDVRFGADQRDAFYDVFARCMRGLGTPVMPAAFFESMARRLADVVDFGVVYRGDVPVASGCAFIWRDECELHWAGWRREERAGSPNMLLYWAFMSRMIERGVSTFDFGRCTAGSTTHAFKRQWGGDDVVLPWTAWSRNGLRAPPTPDQGLYRLAASCWRHLPLVVTNRVGPMLARHLP